MTAPMNQFMTDEYVLAYHGPLLYEARVSLSVIFIPLLGSLQPSLREYGCGEGCWRIDLTGRELDWAEYIIGNGWTTLLHPLQGVETDVRVSSSPFYSSPFSSTPPPPHCSRLPSLSSRIGDEKWTDGQMGRMGPGSPPTKIERSRI